jgi:hypothetical protein
MASSEARKFFFFEKRNKKLLFHYLTRPIRARFVGWASAHHLSSPSHCSPWLTRCNYPAWQVAKQESFSFLKKETKNFPAYQARDTGSAA